MELKKTTAMERKALPMAEFKMSEDGAGGFSAYVSTFGNVDETGEVVVKGAFADTIKQFVEDGFVPPSNHNWDVSGIATITKAYEDDKGLYIEAEFHSTDDAQRERVKMKERLQRGKSVKFSIGYRVLEDEVVKGVRYLKKLELYEACPVNVPANKQAEGVGVKSVQNGGLLNLETKGLLGTDIERSVTLSVLDSLYWRLWNAVYNHLAANPTDAPGLVPIFDEFRDLTVKAATSLMGSEDGAAAIMKSVGELRDRLQVKTADVETATTEATTDAAETEEGEGKEADDKIEPTPDTDDLIAEAEEIKSAAELEMKAGRVLSQTNYDRISAHADKLEQTASALTETAADMRGLLKEASPDSDDPEYIKSRDAIPGELLALELEIAMSY